MNKIYLTSSKHSFKYHVNTFLVMCESKGKCLVINSSYHICISFILNPLPYNIMHSSWFTTSYGGLSFTMSMWSYYWQSRYPFALVPLREWMCNNTWYILKYCHSYYFGEWSTCSKRGFSPFPSPHPMTNGYPYHQKQFPNINGCLSLLTQFT